MEATKLSLGILSKLYLITSVAILTFTNSINIILCLLSFLLILEILVPIGSTLVFHNLNTFYIHGLRDL